MRHKKNPDTEVFLTGKHVDFIQESGLWPPVSIMSLDKANFVDLVCDHLCSDACDTGVFLKAVQRNCEAYRQHLVNEGWVDTVVDRKETRTLRPPSSDDSDSEAGSGGTVANRKKIRTSSPPSPEPATAAEFDRASTAEALLASCDSEAQYALVVGIVTKLLLDNVGNVLSDDAAKNRFHEAVRNLPGGNPLFDSKADFYGLDDLKPVCTENTDEVETDDYPYGSVYETTPQQNATTC